MPLGLAGSLGMRLSHGSSHTERAENEETGTVHRMFLWESTALGHPEAVLEILNDKDRQLSHLTLLMGPENGFVTPNSFILYFILFYFF